MEDAANHFAPELRSWHGKALIGLLLIAALVRLYHVDAPLLDGMSIKQVYCAHRARTIAGPPFDPLRSTFDFLDEEGQRTTLTEEIPLYAGLIGAAYRLFGEHEWFGRAWSVLATLVAMLALYDLVQRRFGRDVALLATALFSFCPLALFCGRSFQPDASMLAGMLAALAFYQRYLDGGKRRWLLAAAAAGLVGALFKYYGLMVLIPLAWETWRLRGWRACFRPAFLFLAATAVVPVALWMAAIFSNNPNPARTGVYFLFQMPGLAVQPMLYERFIDRILYKDCGPLTALLVAAGVWAALARKARPAPVGGLTLMGILFYFLMGPLLRYHDYYELMMLPAASVWAALGWRALWGRPAARTGRWCGAMVLVVGVVVQSPLVMRGNFRLEKGYCVVAERLGRLCSGRGKIVVAGPVEGCDVVHYARREGWTLMGKPDGPAWRERFTHYQRLGAEYAVIYLNPQVPLEDRAAYQTLAESWTVVERATGNWAVGGRPVEYVIVRLEQPDSPRLTNRSVRTGNSE